MNLITSHVPAYKIPAFRAEIAKIQRTAQKLGLPDWTIEEGDPVWRTIPVSINELGEIQTAHMEVIPVSILGAEPVLAGWQFVAKIEHDTNGNLVKSMEPETPADWHDCAPNCSHCDLSRARKITYMVREIASGDIKQVGSSCLSDFIGGNGDPESVFAAFLALRDLTLDYDADADTQTAGGDHAEISAARILAATLQCNDLFGGYLSQERARERMAPSTGDRVVSCFWSPRPDIPLREAEYLPRATEIVEWLAAQSGANSTWLRNIAVLAHRGYVTRQNAPLLASGIVAWERHLAQKNEHQHTGEWVGSAGAKLQLRARLDRMIPFETPYGTKYILNFQTDDGDTVIWRTTALPAGLTSGERYTLATTVKDHAEYKGRKQTEVLRTKVLEFELFTFGGNAARYQKTAADALPDVPRQGITPLHAAVLADRVDEADILLTCGADVNQFITDRIPLSAIAHSDSMARLLLAHGARTALIADTDRAYLSDAARAAYFPVADVEPAPNDADAWVPTP